MQPLIVGAGLSGLIAACHFKESTIIEAGAPIEQHKALLRFRTDAVAKLTGIPFKSVKVRKEVVINNKASNYCSIEAANLYAKKVAGCITGRSIQNLESVERFIAPSDFYWELAGRMDGRIEYRTQFDAEYLTGLEGRPVISTAPMSVNMAAARMPTTGAAAILKRQAIKVTRVKVPGADVYQTIYFADPDFKVYRASMTGDVLIVESMSEHGDHQPISADVLKFFGIEQKDLATETYETVAQRYGKIVEIDRDLRHQVMYNLTTNHNLFSLGRFACWRNILLDDVVKDIEVISNLVKASDYARSRVFLGGK